MISLARFGLKLHSLELITMQRVESIKIWYDRGRVCSALHSLLFEGFVESQRNHCYVR